MSDELFPPRPGGLVDTQRREQTAPAGLPQTVEVHDGPVAYQAVRVRPETADLGTARTITLSAANPWLQLLGQDGQRRDCVVLAVDNDVWVSNDKGAAQQAAGSATGETCFYLPAGIGIPFTTQAPMFVAATTTGAISRVSVLITRDSAP